MPVKTAPPIIEHDPDRATLVFEVTPGPRTVIARSIVTGRPLEPAAKIQARLEIMPGQPYEPGELRRRLADYVTTLRHRRYYEASANAAPPAFNEDRTRADVTVDIQPGPLVTIEFTGGRGQAPRRYLDGKSFSTAAPAAAKSSYAT